MRPFAAIGALALLLSGVAHAAVEKRVGELTVQVAEVSRSVDLSKGKEEFLTVTLEVSGSDALRLRRVQPVRDDFHLIAGKQNEVCRWLRGGSVPDDPNRLRFTVGFPMPKAAKTVSLRVEVPRIDRDDVLELRLADLTGGNGAQERSGKDWSVTVDDFSEREYTPPSLPKDGRYFSKAGPVDTRVYRKAKAGDPEPARAYRLSFHSKDVGLYDQTLDVTGRLLTDGGAAPLLAARLRRDPSASVKKPPYPPFVQGEFFFAVPKGRATGAIIELHRQPPKAPRQSVTFEGLPVPGVR